MCLGHLKKVKLLSLAEHYKVMVTQTMRKIEIQMKLV